MTNDAASAARAARQRPALWLGAVLLLVAVVFARGLAGDFVWDDRYLILDDPRVQDPHRVGEIFTEPFAHSERAGRLMSYYRPLVTLSYYVDFQFLGRSPLGFHVTNLFLHLLVTALLWLHVRTLLASVVAASITALAFGLHPAHVPSVAWVAGRVDLISGALLLAALWIVARTRTGASPPAARWLSLPALLLALAAKEVAFVFPVLVLAQDLYQRRQAAAPARGFDWRYHLAVVGVCVLFLGLRQQVLGDAAQPSLRGLGARIDNVAAVLAHHLRLVFVPFGLRGFYFAGAIAEGRALAVAAVGFTFGILAFAVLRRRDLALLGGVFVLVLLIPVVDLAAFDEACVYLAADHRVYLPTIGGVLMLAGILYPWARHCAGSRARWLAGAALAAASAAGAIEIQRTIGTFRDEATLFATLAQRDPSDEAFLLQGFAALEREDPVTAERSFRSGVAMAPQNWRQHFGLGQALIARGRCDEAMQALGRAATFEGAFTDVFNDLGNLHLLAGNLAAARAQYERALAVEPRNHNAMFNLSQACVQAGDRPAARQYLSRFLREAPAVYAKQKALAQQQLQGL